MYNATFISDLHLGSKHCQADKLYDFLKNLKTKKLYLVGDILDGWRLKKKWYWPKSHNKVVKLILDMAKDIEVVYITGNQVEYLIGLTIAVPRKLTSVFHRDKYGIAWIFGGPSFPRFFIFSLLNNSAYCIRMFLCKSIFDIRLGR